VATDVGLGDIEVHFLDVEPGDGTTAGTLTVHPPTGDAFTVPVTAGTPTDGVVRLTAGPVTYDQGNRWVLHWKVTGTGASEEDAEVYVVATPVAGGPTWTPGRSRVANYIPSRTLARNPATYKASGDSYALTFDSTTRPNGVQVDRLIADAVAWLGVANLAASLYDKAAACCAIWAAAAVERGWPDGDESLRRAEQLQELAEKMRAEIIAANTAETGENPQNPGSTLLPIYSFPASVPWGDDLFL
jgi:hypothetical protein